MAGRNGDVWAGTSLGAARFDGATSWIPFGQAQGLLHADVLCIALDISGRTWFGAPEGVTRYDGTSWVFRPTTYPVISILADSYGRIWLGTGGGGVERLDGPRATKYMAADGLPSNRETRIIEDRYGAVWVASGHEAFPTGIGIAGGLSRFEGDAPVTYADANGMAIHDVREVVQDHSGRYWLALSNVGALSFDGTSWTHYTAADIGISDVTDVLCDSHGNIWFVGYWGAVKYNGSTWSSLPSLEGYQAFTAFEDRQQNIWFGTRDAGAFKYDPVSGTMTNYNKANSGLAENFVWCIAQDSTNAMWFGTVGVGSILGGASRFDGTEWKIFTNASTNGGLGHDFVYEMHADRKGILWFATFGGGIRSFDGNSWRGYTTADGLPTNSAISIAEDPVGDLWFGYYFRGAGRFNGTWGRFSREDGLGGYLAQAILVDDGGVLWFGTESGLTRYDPDRTAPKTLLLSAPPAITAARDVSISFTTAYESADQMVFSYRENGGPWSPWDSRGSWSATGIPDGPHLIEVRSKDRLGNVDPYPISVNFYVDATPPAAVLTEPRDGSVVSGVVHVRGTASDDRFSVYDVLVRKKGSPSWNDSDIEFRFQYEQPVTAGPLRDWDTSGFPDGDYEIRLVVRDNLGLAGEATVGVTVDNQPPSASVTSPRRIIDATGGDIYTLNGEAHLYVPPRAFHEDATVWMASVPSDSLPLTAGPGTAGVGAGCDLSFSARLLKGARLDLAIPTSVTASGITIYRSSDNANWERFGGTLVDGRLQAIVTESGRYALFADSGFTTGAGNLSDIVFSPRVFSPRGAFADKEVGIGFTLGRPATVTVRVYSRSGRLVRELASGQSFAAGSNLVRWDGRDLNDQIAEDGLYLVTVEAMGQVRKDTVALVR